MLTAFKEFSHVYYSVVFACDGDERGFIGMAKVERGFSNLSFSMCEQSTQTQTHTKRAKKSIMP